MALTAMATPHVRAEHLGDLRALTAEALDRITQELYAVHSEIFECQKSWSNRSPGLDPHAPILWGSLRV